MIRFVLKRFALLIPVIIGVSLLVYILLDMAPGTIVDSIISDSSLTAEEIEELKAEYDLDKSVFYRYGKYMKQLLHGDLGKSDVTGFDVWQTYISKLPNTLLLAFSALIIGASMAIPMGIRAARHAGTLTDNATTVFTLIGISMPAFWLGLLLLQVFSMKLGWFPAGGNRNGILSLVLPAITSGFIHMASLARQTRSSMLEVLHADYLDTARAKGVPEEVVIKKHALGNAWIPILTTLGNSMSRALAGAVVVETVFAWPGVGRMASEAVKLRDVTTTLGCVIMTSIIICVVQILVDLLYALVDPRIKSQYANANKSRKRGA